MQVDHVNGDKSDNRWSNLRLATNSQNQHNKPAAKGYSWYESRNKWQAYIRHNSKRTHLGYFETEAEARAAYLAAKVLLHEEFMPEAFKAEAAAL